jgi:hypothetical protein
MSTGDHGVRPAEGSVAERVEVVRDCLGLSVGATWPEIAATAVEVLGLDEDVAQLPLTQILELSHAKLFMSRSL